MVVFSSFVSSITASMTHIRHHQNEMEQSQRELRSFFTDKQVSAELYQRIWHHVKVSHWSSRKVAHEKDLKVLATLPEILKSKLRDELFSPTLTKAPFMLVISAIDSHGMSGLCFKAVTEKSLVPKEELFVDGMVATKMYFLSAGAMEYVRKTGGVVATKENQQASEPALWMNWLHCGTLSATSHCEVLELDSKCFRAILLTHETSLPFLCRYALLFHKTVSHTKDWATDLWDRVLLQSLAETAGEKRSTRAEMKTKTVSAKAFRFLRRTSMKNTLK